MFAMDVSTDDRIFVDGQVFQPGEIETAGGVTTMEDYSGKVARFRYNDLVTLACACGASAISDRGMGGYGRCVECFNLACFGPQEAQR